MTANRDDNKPPKLAWGLDEAAKATGLSRAYFRKIIAAGEIRTIRAGSRVLILDSELRAWLSKASSQAPLAS